MSIFFWVAAAIFGLFAFVVFFGAPYVPARKRDVTKALDELYQIKSSDLLVDLGSGDGKVLREVSARGGRALGIELNPILVLISRWLSWGDKRVEVRLGNLIKESFPADTTVVYMFAASRYSRQFGDKVQREAERLGRSLYVLSYAFELPGRTHIKRDALHFLYEIKPMQQKKHKV